VTCPGESRVNGNGVTPPRTPPGVTPPRTPPGTPKKTASRSSSPRTSLPANSGECVIASDCMADVSDGG